MRSVKLWQSNTNPTLGCQRGEDVRRNVVLNCAINVKDNFGEETDHEPKSEAGSSFM